MIFPKKIVILATGGTIAGTAASSHDNVGYTAASLGIQDLLSDLVLEPFCRHVIESEQVAQIDSKDMTWPVLRSLALRVSKLLADPAVNGLVITHGTDTLEETAFFLQLVCQPLKPVVITGAMRPATSSYPDGPQNLQDAIAVASQATLAGVLVVFAGRIYDAFSVRKSSAYRMDAFESGESGCVGVVEKGHVRPIGCVLPPQLMDHRKAFAAIERATADADWPRVEIVMNYVSADGLVVEALAEHGVSGLVVAGTGNGTVHRSLEKALIAAKRKGIAVVLSTRCAEGRTLNVPHDLFDRSEHLSAVKTRILMTVQLMQSAR